MEHLEGWSDLTPPGDLPYDFLLNDGTDPVRVQVKLQRSKAHSPMLAKSIRAFQSFPMDMYVVETQKTRGGSNRKTGGSTRPYRFGEFDLLAVAMYPSTNEWNRFMYTVSDWLIAGRTDSAEISKFQPVAMTPNDDWTDDFRMAVGWVRSGVKKTIRSS